MTLKSLPKRLYEFISARLVPARRLSASLLRDGMRLQAAGDDAGAELMFRRALTARPRDAEAEYLLGALLGKCNRTDEAQAHLLRAISLAPDLAAAHTGLGNVHLLRGKLAEAHKCYCEALRLDSSNPVLLFNLGFLHQCQMDFPLALEYFERAYVLSPEMPGIVKNVTLMRVELGQCDKAEVHLRELLRARTEDFEVLFSLGYVLQHAHQPDRAIGYFEQARRLNVSDVDLLLNSGIVLRELGRTDEALQEFDAALALKPGSELALWHQSLTHLLRQDFARGWEKYGVRLLSKDRPQRTSHLPEWAGEDISASRILIYGEQGIGDEIMFASCLPQMIATSRACVVECSGKLQGLFSRSFPGATVRAAAVSGAPSKDVDCDVQSAIGTLPRYLRRHQADFPRHDGYLRADPDRVDAWRRRLDAIGDSPKIGISWRGGSFKTRSPVRSIALERWAPILSTPGVDFVDLQYTDCSDEIDDVQSRFGHRIYRWSEVRDDFEETAALVAALDLVISVCTAVIHLGGALAKPVWVMAPFSPEWRYGISGNSMPWYPSVRMFRQTSYGDWSPVIDDVAQSLLEWRSGIADASNQTMSRQQWKP